MSRFIKRMIGAALFNSRIYEEVEADRGATWQALAVVLLVSFVRKVREERAGGATPNRCRSA